MTVRGPKGPRRGANLQDIGIIPDGSLLIRDGVIQEVGPTRRVENLGIAREAIEIPATGRVVMPGFVDSHTHLVSPPPGLAAHEHENAVRTIRRETGQRIQGRTQSHLETMARHGTTTVEAKTGCGPDESAEMKLFRVFAALQNHPLDVVPTFLFRLPRSDFADRGGLAEAAKWVWHELLPKIQRRRFAAFADVAWEGDAGAWGLYGRYLEIARRLGFACKIHAEATDVTAAIAMAGHYGAVSIDHLEHATAQDVELLAASDTMATLLPCTTFHNGWASAPARTLVDTGVAVALASNFNPQVTPTLNMQTVVAVACMQLGMTPAEAISAATINGAHALGRGDRVGSLELGKEADVLVLNVSDYRDVAYHLGENLVHLTMKRGEFIYKEGDVAPLDADDLRPAPLWEA